MQNISKKTDITLKTKCFLLYVCTENYKLTYFYKKYLHKKEEPSDSSFYFDYANNAIRFFADSDCSCAFWIALDSST